MRIAFLNSWLESRARGSGSAVAIDGLARGLEALGHRVDRIEPAVGRGGAVGRLAFNATLPARFDPSPYDLVVGFDFDGCWLGPLPVPRVTCLKGIMADEARFESGLTRLRFRLLSRLERRAARRADRVVVTSEYSRRTAVRRYGVAPDRVDVVPEGIDPDRWMDADAAGSAAGRTGPEGGTEPEDRAATDAGPARVILNVARQYPRKDTATLLRALPSVRRAVPGTRLRIVGGGPRLPALRRLASELGIAPHVDFAGELESLADLRRAYRRARVFCLPSLQEGFGIVCLEAMASGCPVVAARAGALPEVVPDGEAGLLVPPRDEVALADALARVLTDDALHGRLAAAGRERARRFAWPTVAGRFLDTVAAGGDVALFR